MARFSPPPPRPAWMVRREQRAPYVLAVLPVLLADSLKDGSLDERGLASDAVRIADAALNALVRPEGCYCDDYPDHEQPDCKGKD